MRSCSIVCEKSWKASAASCATVNRPTVIRPVVIRPIATQAAGRKNNVCGARDRNLSLGVLFGLRCAVDRGVLLVAAGLVLLPAVFSAALCRSFVWSASASASSLRGGHIGAHRAFVCVAGAPRHRRAAGRRPIGVRTMRISTGAAWNGECCAGVAENLPDYSQLGQRSRFRELECPGSGVANFAGGSGAYGCRRSASASVDVGGGGISSNHERASNRFTA